MPRAKKRDIFPAGKVWFLPPRPRRYFRAAEIRYLPRFRGKYFFHWLFIWIKKWDSEIFLLQRTATKFGANIIWLLFYLFVESPRLRGVENAAVSRRPLRVCEKFLLVGL